MNKAQLHMGETIIIIFIFIVMLSIGLIYYTQFRSEGIQEEAQELKASSSTAFLSILSQVPEIKCSEKTKEEECIDTVKVIAFNSVINKNIEHYRSIFQGRKVSVELLYPRPTKKAICNQQTYNAIEYPLNCNEYIIYQPTITPKTQRIISTPISLYFPDTDSYGIGRLKITY